MNNIKICHNRIRIISNDKPKKLLKLMLGRIIWIKFFLYFKASAILITTN